MSDVQSSLADWPDHDGADRKELPRMPHSECDGSDGPRHASYVLPELLELTAAYCRCLSGFDGRQPCWDVAADLERPLANAMRRILGCIEELEKNWKGREGVLLGLEKERRFKRLKKVVLSQVERWKWTAFVNARTGGALVEEHYLEHRKLKEEPFLRACLAWRKDDNAEEHRAADRYAQTALMLNLEPLPISPDEAQELTWQLHRKWCDDPSLGESLPTPTTTTEEMREVESILDDFRQWVPTLVTPAQMKEASLAGQAIRREYEERVAQNEPSSHRQEPETVELSEHSPPIPAGRPDEVSANTSDDTPSVGKRPAFRAGEAFRNRIENDPEARAATGRALARFDPLRFREMTDSIQAALDSMSLRLGRSESVERAILAVRPSEEPGDDPRFITFAEAVKITAVSKSTLTKWANKGKISDNGKRGRGKRRIDAASLARHMANRDRQGDDVS